MLELKVRGTGSWLDPVSVKGLSANLSERLWDRCKGHRGLFITLTYDRTKYDDAASLYRAAQDEQHVPLVLRKVARYLDVNLKGKWFCKLEFQEGGWVHWHLLILDVAKIPHEELTHMWGKGHVWVRRLNRRNVKYCTKYTAKGGDVPAWLLCERPRAIKIIRVSPGFWKRSGADSAASAGGDPPGTGEGPDDAAELDPPPLKSPCYVSIGQRLDQHYGNGYQRLVARDDNGRYGQLDADLGPLLAALLVLGCGIVGKRNGWLVIDATMDQLETAYEDLHQTARNQGGPARPLCGRGPRRAGASLHLIETSNPDTDLMAMLPPSLNRWYEYHAEQGVAA